MPALDYLLYDNRTWAPRIGRDWGVKAATGILASRPDLRSVFDRYCGALPSEHGYLSRFDQALGGVRHGDGYLLCVALETTDPFGRSSWAIYGLWCPDVVTVEDTLANDPIGAAQAALGTEPPPPTISLSTFEPAPLPVPRHHADRTVFRRFDGTSSISETVALLLGAIQRKTPLPNVLGITASSRLAELGLQFDVVYCHPLNDRAERALEQCRSDEPFAMVEPDTTAPVPVPPSGSHARTAILWATSLVATATIVIAFRWPQRMVFHESRAESPAETTLLEIQTRIDELRTLDPQDLRNAARKDDPQELLDAYAALIQDRERIIDDYEEPDVQAPDAAAQLRRIRLILDEHSLGGDACRVVDVTNPTVRQWCASFVSLEHAAHTHSSQRTTP